MSNSQDLLINLDVAVPASNPQRFAVRGKYIAVDPGSTGQTNLRINSIADVPRLASPGQTFNPGDFTDLYFDYIAQPGKFLHVIYGDSPDILNAGGKITIDPSLPQLTTDGRIIVSSNTTIVTAANNPRGIRILGGFATAIAGLPAGSTTGGGLAYVNGANQILLHMAYALNSGGSSFGSVYQEPFYIPPGCEMQVTVTISAGGVLIYTYNYTIL